jgi:hypothetical protein
MVWLAALIAIPVTIWALAALYLDFQIALLRVPIALTYAGVIAAILFIFGLSETGVLLWLASLALVIVWWLRIAPSNNRDWQPDVAELPWAEINGNLATIHNIRDVDYRSELDYTPHWKTRTVDLSEICEIDLFLTHWGPRWIAHPIVSFKFTDGTYLAISTEARKQVGQTYSAVRGFFRQFELIYIIAEERDVAGLRAYYRKSEIVRLYRTLTKPADARDLFVQYLRWMEHLRTHAEWYNALTSNCTTRVISHLESAKIGGLSRYDWRTLLNGRGDEMLYDLGDLATSGLSFGELAERAVVNGVPKQPDSAIDFSRRIRKGRPGFEI